MTEEKEEPVRYLNKANIKIIHSELREQSKRDGEPIPSFNSNIAKERKLESLLNTPQLSLFGKELYPDLASKAAIIFYSINKNHYFVNGNKRMSTYCLLVFLRINGKDLDINPDELTEKALEVAKADTQEFEDIKGDLKKWIGDNLVDYQFSK